MVTVKNISEHPRQFPDRKTGGMVIVAPGDTVETDNPPKPASVWEIEGGTKKEKKTAKKAEEVE